MILLYSKGNFLVSYICWIASGFCIIILEFQQFSALPGRPLKVYRQQMNTDFGMSLKNKLTQLFDWVARQGVKGKRSSEDSVTALMNKVAFITALGSITTFLISFCFEQVGLLYRSLLIALFFLYSFIVVLHSFGKIKAARIYITTFLAAWIYLACLFFNGFFSQSIASVATIVLAFMFFKREKKLQYLTIGYNVVFYALVNIYLAFYPPLAGKKDMPFDEVIVFILALMWIYVIFEAHEAEKDSLIKDLGEKNRQLLQTTEELERFTHIASHDLKSPLRNVISFLGLIERDIKRKEINNLKENLQFAKNGAYQLNTLINDISVMSILNHEESREPELLELNSIADLALNNLANEMREKPFEIKVSSLPKINARKLEMVVLFQNLIQNGIKYNENEKPLISISSENNFDSFKLIFKDNGIGIEEEYHEQIFGFFKRLHNSEKYKGTGLGLALCNKIVKNMSGHIFIKSELGKGSEFIVRFPKELIAE